MGCITSTQPKKNMVLGSISSQTQLMLKLSGKQKIHEQLQIIIDDDKYKYVQNTIKSSQRDISSTSGTNTNATKSDENVNYEKIENDENSVSLSSHSSDHEPSSSSNRLNKIITPGASGFVLMGFASNNNNNNKGEDSMTYDDSEPSLLQTNTVTLMGLADKNEIFVHSNHDLSNKNPNLQHYLNKNDNINDNEEKLNNQQPITCA